MSLVELGELLREERLKRNLTVDEVGSYLKMSSRVIRDLEEGNGAALPPVYVRGFIKSYAHFLDISLSPAALAFLETGGGGTPEPKLVKRDPPAAPTQSKGWGLKILVLLCCLGFAGFVYYGTYMASRNSTVGVLFERISTGFDSVVSSFSGSSGSSASSTPARPLLVAPEPDAAETPDESGPESVFPGTSGESLAGNDTDGDPVEITEETGNPGASGLVEDTADFEIDLDAAMAEEEMPVRTEGFRAPRVPLPETGTRQGKPHTVGIAQLPGENPSNQVILTGVTECYVHSTADETDTRQLSLMPGHIFSLSFRNTLAIKLGNAGGVRLTYNGRELPVPGKDGQVLTLTFPEAVRNELYGMD